LGVTMSETPPQLLVEMGDYRSHLRALDHLVGLACREAERLASVAVGPPHIVLAILNPRAGESLAARALRDCGVTYERAEELTSSYGARDGAPRTPQFNPAALHLKYLAEGIAAGLGDVEVQGEHVLLAYLWMPEQSGRAFEQLGTSREQVRDRLAELGVSLPETDLPASDPRRYGPKIEVSLDELAILLKELWYVLPQGACFTWNRDRKKGWLNLTEGLDPDDYIKQALERHQRSHYEDRDAKQR
jgi:hypothetical protein